MMYETQGRTEKGHRAATTSYVKKLAPQKIALRTIPVTLVNGNKRIKGNAFLDNGSTATYICEDVANYLGWRLITSESLH